MEKFDKTANTLIIIATLCVTGLLLQYFGILNISYWWFLAPMVALCLVFIAAAIILVIITSNTHNE